ncbi:heat shock transcription factor, Y-linked-like [Gallus gallus]|uniref:heat shock transcription factor, Y-linked-like n=1 Tax=Gallus gallus TaxID=9031 RepID=UPI001AE9D5D7|nr:heat shock transcription factor, Y-linked-like [Gallus gallus]
METSSSQTPGVSVPNTHSAALASAARPVRHKRAAQDAALGPTKEEKASPFSHGEPHAKRRHHDLSEKCSAKAKDLSPCYFLKNLWKVIESNHFQSISWGNDGDFIVIKEPFFRTEVLARRGPLKIFDIDSMKSFVQHLHHHGFYIIEGDLPSSASHAEILAEGAAISTPCELLCYYNPHFKRDYLLWQKKFKWSVGVKRRRPAASSPALDLKEGQQRRLLEMQSGAAASAGSEFPVTTQDAAPAASANRTSLVPSNPLPPGLGPDSRAGGGGVGCPYNLRSRKHCR